MFSSRSCLQLRRCPCDFLDHLRAIFCSASLPSFSAQLLSSGPARAPRDSDPRRRTAVGGHAIRVLRGRRRVRSRVHRGNHGLCDREGRRERGCLFLTLWEWQLGVFTSAAPGGLLLLSLRNSKRHASSQKLNERTKSLYKVDGNPASPQTIHRFGRPILRLDRFPRPVRRRLHVPGSTNPGSRLRGPAPPVNEK